MRRLILQTRPVDRSVGRARYSLSQNDVLVIIGPNDEFTKSLANQLRRCQVRVHVYSWDQPPSKIDNIGGLVFVAPERDDDVAIMAFQWLQYTAPALRATRKVNHAFLVCVSRFGGDFGLKHGCRCPEAAALGGLIKTARHEWPEVHCRVIDTVENPTTDAIKLIADELFYIDPLEIGISDLGICELVLDSQPQTDSTNRLSIRPGELVIISGGARGVTAEAVLELAREYRPTLLLLGRSLTPTPEPAWLSRLTDESSIKKALFAHAERRLTPRELGEAYQRAMAEREIINNLARLRETGATVEYKAVDIRNHTSVAHVIENARQTYGPVRGIVHGSGVLADKRIEDKTVEQFELVFGTKVDGLNALISAVGTDPVAFIGLFSSSTARFGRLGQCDYAAANEVLNATARQLAHECPNCRVVAFNWGPWEGGMVTPALRSVFAAEGVGLIPLEDGARFFVNELAGEDRSTDVVVLGPAPTETELSIGRMPWLADHVLDGWPVMPLAVILEAFVQYTQQGVTSKGPLAIRDLRVLRPVLLKDKPVHLMMRKSNDSLELGTEVTGPPHYRCAVSQEGHEPHVVPNHRDLKPFPLSVQAAYRTVLFHGPSFQCIETIEGYSADGIRVKSRGLMASTRWWNEAAPADRITEPLAIDAALQAIILWTWAERNELSLPMAIGNYRQFVRPFPVGPYSINVTIFKSSASSIRANATINDGNGQRIADLDNCEFIVTDQLPAAFGKTLVVAGAAR